MDKTIPPDEKVIHEITRLLDAAAHGEPHAPAELLPLVYEELRKLAAHRMTAERSGPHTTRDRGCSARSLYPVGR